MTRLRGFWAASIVGGRRNDGRAAEPGGRYVEGSEGRVFGITATAATDNGARVGWQAVAWLTGDPERPYAIRRWRRAAAEVFDE